MALRAGRVGVHPSQVDPNGKVKAGLSPEQQAKLDRALLTPVSAPVATELVGISTGREQLNIGVGEGLGLSAGKLGISFAVGDAGKVLKVNENGDGVEWADPPSGGVINALTLTPLTGLKVSSSSVTAFSSYKTYVIPFSTKVYLLGIRNGYDADFEYAVGDVSNPVAGTSVTGYQATKLRDYNPAYTIANPAAQKYVYVSIREDYIEYFGGVYIISS